MLEVESNFTTCHAFLPSIFCLSLSVFLSLSVIANGEWKWRTRIRRGPVLRRIIGVEPSKSSAWFMHLLPPPWRCGQTAYGYGGLGGKNPKQPPGMYKTLCVMGWNTNLDCRISEPSNHQQYVSYSWRDLPSEKWWCLRWALSRGWISFFESDILKRTWSSLDLLSLDSPNQCMAFDVRASPTSIANGRPTDYIDLLSYDAGSERSSNPEKQSTPYHC